MPREVVREIDWVEVFPWLCLVRTITLALDPRKIALAIVGVLLTWAGWSLIDYLSQRSHVEGDVQTTVRQLSFQPRHPLDRRPATEFGQSHGSLLTAGDEMWDAAKEVPAWYAQPFWGLFDSGSSIGQVLLSAAAVVWMLAVWAFCGGAITRLAAVRLAQDRRLSFRQACGHAISKWFSYFGSPLFPLAGVLVLLVVPAMIAGLIAQTGIGFSIVGALWPIGMILALLAACLLVALFLGWPLMWATVSTEATDPFDSFSRSLSYVSQRPFHYAFYIVVAGVLGIVGWFVVTLFGELVIQLTAWGVTWGSDAQRAGEILTAVETGVSNSFGASAITAWNDCVRLVVYGYAHSFFWCAASGIYLLIRHATDATPLAEVHLDIAEDPYALPRLRTDAAGVPVVDEEAEEPAGVGG